MIDAALAVFVVAMAATSGWVVFLAREQRIETRTVRILAVLCALALVSMLLSDWPSELLAEFWADHSVVAGILSTMLLVGIAFLAFEDSERRAQDRLDTSVTAVGLGGIVDHVIDVEVALALLSEHGSPDTVGWEGWDAKDKPLRWLRRHHDRLENAGQIAETDPRCLPATLPGTSDQEGPGRPHRIAGAAHEAPLQGKLPAQDAATEQSADPKYPDKTRWRQELVDQCVRRLLAAIRDWSPVIRGSKNGVMVLIAVSEIRKDLMELGQRLEAGSPVIPTDLLLSLRQRLRLLAHFLETQSGANPLRPEVLLTLSPLPNWDADLNWAADADGASTFSKEWRNQLKTTQRQLQQDGQR